ncbi:MAG: hypothetical protein B6D61_11120, partial [Bacteroidetes bacterium 4484_249]
MGDFKPMSNINVKGNLLIENGKWEDSAPGLIHYFEGDFTVTIDGNYYTNLNTTAVFKGLSDQVITFNTPITQGYFHTVIIDKTDWPVDKTFG